jgi:hypothetical protein
MVHVDANPRWATKNVDLFIGPRCGSRFAWTVFSTLRHDASFIKIGLDTLIWIILDQHACIVRRYRKTSQELGRALSSRWVRKCLAS